MTRNLIAALLVSTTLVAAGAGTVVGLPVLIGTQQDAPVTMDW